jgi:protein-tyrosine phosphatase
MIDIHTHLLPGVDDGSPSIEASVPILDQFGAGGVTVVVCTPHLNASQASSAPYARHREILEEMMIEAPPVPQLLLGWEIMLDIPGANLTDRKLSLGNSTAVLIEFGRTGLPPTAAQEIYRLRMSGIVPVVAHPERYWGCTPALMAEWRSAGAVIQMDVSALVGARRMSAVAEALLAHGLVDVVASDTHVDNRSLVAGRRWLEEYASVETAQLLTVENPRRLLANDELVPVSPMEPRRGMLHRLRELLLNRP